MSEPIVINLTYRTPCVDIDKCTAYNADGTINIKCTLLTFRNMLNENINKINGLIENFNHVTNISTIDDDFIRVSFDNNDVLNDLLEKNIVKEISDDDNDHENNLYFSDNDIETNQDRFGMMNNMITRNDSQIIFDKVDTSDTDTSESDNVINDEDNSRLIINKYSKLVASHQSDNDDDIQESS